MRRSHALRIHGNLQGLKPVHRNRLAKLYERACAEQDIISVGLANTLSELSFETGRQIGITIDRRGRIRHVIVGDAEHIFIPDLGRSRAGEGRFRGIRLVHTHLHQEPLSEEDLTDLIRLRFDMIAALGVGRDGRPGRLYHTHLMPFGSKTPTAPQTESTIHNSAVQFDIFIEALEEEFARRNVGTLDTGDQTRAIAVHVSTPSQAVKPQTALRELGELAMTANVIIMDALVQKRRRFDPKYLVGQGKLNDLLQLTMQLDCELVIFDQSLTPNQVRCISEATDVKVIDRSMLILDIFARRALTREGKLAVELAQLQYLLPRLAHKNTAFSRLAGGIGGRGPGETKLEIDRRRARDRIGSIKQLAQTEVQRKNRRRRRNHRQVQGVYSQLHKRR